jgi:DNA-binding LacI/PurR family transcriptional regulator
MARKSIIAVSIYNDLKDKIQGGQLQDGTILPSEGQLCKSYEASRVSIRAALNRLKDDQFVCSQAGKGWMVGAKVAPLPKKKSSHKEVNVPSRSGGPPTFGEVIFMSNSMNFSAILYRGLVTGMKAFGLPVRFLMTTGFSEDYVDYLQRNADEYKNAKGLVLFEDNPLTEDSILALKSLNIPVLLAGYSRQASFDSVTCDGRHGMSELIAQLASEGHERIAFVYNPSQAHIPSFIDRESGYLEGMMTAGLNPLVIPYGWEDAESLELQEKFSMHFKEVRGINPVTAMILTTVELVREGSMVLVSQGVDVGKIVRYGFGNCYAHAGELQRQQSAIGLVNENWEEVGLVCAKQLIGRIMGKDKYQATLTYVKTDVLAPNSY